MPSSSRRAGPVVPGGSPKAKGDLDELAASIGYSFADPALLATALTHGSLGRRRQARAENYERLEFVGDRVLGLVVAERLYQMFPSEDEGAMAKRFAALVQRETVAEVGRALGLAAHMRLSKAEEAAGGRDNTAIIADCCEALIGALFIDGGLEAARDFVLPQWTPLIEADVQPPEEAKTALQEWAQGRGLPLPAYAPVSRSGPDHDPTFTVEVRVEGLPPTQGRGRSKRLAEQDAAARLLAELAEERT